MPDDEDVDEILDPELSKEEKRRQKTQELNEELGEYEIDQSDNNYDVFDAVEDLQETKKVEDSDAVERRVRAQMKLEEEKEKARKKSKSGHDFHHAWSILIGVALSGLGFLYNGVFHNLGILGLLYLIYDSTEIFPGQSQGKFAYFVSNHPKYYSAGFFVTYLLFYGSFEHIPEPQSLISLTVSTVISWV